MVSTMRKFVISMSLLICAAPALCAEVPGPTETISVNGASLVGIWKFSAPQSVDFAFLSKAKWGANGDAFCQIEEINAELSVHCLGLRIARKDVSRGTMRVKGNSLRMIWESNLFHLGINGTFQSADQFEGIFFAQFLGISDDAPDKATGARLILSADAPDKGGKADLLARMLKEMATGSLTVPLDTSGLALTGKANASYIKILKPDTLGSLGSIQSIIYLGETDRREASISNYDVEFSNGHLICGLHQAADSRLDQFDCG